MSEPASQRNEPGVDPDELARAMAVYSADGQADDETGGDAAAERLRQLQDEPGADPS